MATVYIFCTCILFISVAREEMNNKYMNKLKDCTCTLYIRRLTYYNFFFTYFNVLYQNYILNNVLYIPYHNVSLFINCILCIILLFSLVKMRFFKVTAITTDIVRSIYFIYLYIYYR